jgi:hypothetical protein
MSEFDVDAMLARYRERAAAVKDRPMPPVEGDVRRLFIKQAETDYLDYLLIGRAAWEVDGANLVLRIPLNGE